MIRFQQKETLSDVSSFKVSENQLAYCSLDTIYLDKVKIVEGTSSYFFYQLCDGCTVAEAYQRVLLAITEY